MRKFRPTTLIMKDTLLDLDCSSDDLVGIISDSFLGVDLLSKDAFLSTLTSKADKLTADVYSHLKDDHSSFLHLARDSSDKYGSILGNLKDYAAKYRLDSDARDISIRTAKSFYTMIGKISSDGRDISDDPFSVPIFPFSGNVGINGVCSCLSTAATYFLDNLNIRDDNIDIKIRAFAIKDLMDSDYKKYAKSLADADLALQNTGLVKKCRYDIPGLDLSYYLK